MIEKSYIVFADDVAWRVGILSGNGNEILEGPSEPDELATWLKDKGYTGQGVALALPSRWCLSARVSTEALPSRGRLRAMTFRLEEKLPLAAEEFIADFAGEGPEVLGVCTRIAKLQAIVEGLEAAGIAVEVICPAVLLALQGRQAMEDINLWMLSEGEGLNIIAQEGKTLTGWFLLPNSPKDVRLQLNLTALSGRKHIRIGASGINAAITEAIRSSPDADLALADQLDLFESATQVAGTILSGGQEPLINFRRDRLAIRDRYRQIARPLHFVATAVTVCLFCACAALVWRAHQYFTIQMAAEDQVMVVFRRTFPGQSSPATNVRRRMESEERGLRGVSGKLPAASASSSALRILHDLIASLPTDVRFRIVEMRVEDGKLYLEGITRTHSDADAIADRLRKDGHLLLSEPLSEQLSDQSVSFVINAIYPTLLSSPIGEGVR